MNSAVLTLSLLIVSTYLKESSISVMLFMLRCQETSCLYDHRVCMKETVCMCGNGSGLSAFWEINPPKREQFEIRYIKTESLTDNLSKHTIIHYPG